MCCHCTNVKYCTVLCTVRKNYSICKLIHPNFMLPHSKDMCAGVAVVIAPSPTDKILGSVGGFYRGLNPPPHPLRKDLGRFRVKLLKWGCRRCTGAAYVICCGSLYVASLLADNTFCSVNVRSAIRRPTFIVGAVTCVRHFVTVL